MSTKRTGLVAASVVLTLAVTVVFYAYFSASPFWIEMLVFFVVPALSALLFAIHEWANPPGYRNE
jgi:hypothetical protein